MHTTGGKLMEKKKKKIELNAFVIIFCIMIFCALLTWIIPAGQFETAFNEVTGRDLFRELISKLKVPR